MVKAIVGANWGDEGKGKITDMLAESSDVVIRFQGGANAGHTIINDRGRFALHTLPSGAFYPHVTNIIGNGVALDIRKLVDELRSITDQGVPAPNLIISERAQLLMPYHTLQDAYEEERLGGKAFGSTKSGIAPFYSDKYAKIGIQVCDLFHEDRLMERLTAALAIKNVLFQHLYHKPALDAQELFQQLLSLREEIRPYVGDAVGFVHQALKEGKQEFLHRARLIRRYGAAAVVMLFDEQGQADTYARKIEVAQRAYKLLTDDGFPAEDIIFDPNILAVATGIEAHDAYARDFIEAVRWIKQNLPHAKISGGVSNLSFAFRGNNAVREAMHSVFLYHAIQAGMDMAIVNPQMLQIYSDIEPELLERVEDVILCRRADAAERLTEYASQFTKTAATQTQHTDAWRSEPLGKRIEYAMLKGVADYIEQDALEGYRTLGSPLAVIDRLLMPAMEVVGNLFGQGKMFLPQVVKTARVMKKAVAVLTPYIEQGSEANAKSAGKVLVATVKGDVHDIGKNIVAVVMACNGYTIRDLGVMVECPRIIDEAVAWGADAICLSGLITPSLEEMIHVCEELERRGLQIPVLIGGATTSDVHTAVKIAPTYSGPVIHADNASRNNKILGELLGPGREEYLARVREEQQTLRDQYRRREEIRTILPFGQVRKLRVPKPASEIAVPAHTGRLVFPDISIADVEPLIDWNFFFPAWGLKGRVPEIFENPEHGAEARKLYDDAQKMLARIREEKLLTLQGVAGIFAAVSRGDDIVVTGPKDKKYILPMLRSQAPVREAQARCLADFIADEKAGRTDYIGAFALTGGIGLKELTEKFRAEGDDYNAILSKLLADRLTEALCEWVHIFIRRQMWGYETGPALTPEQIIRSKYRGRRMAFGYPACPDHSLKREVFDLLAADKTTAMRLNDNYMITPEEALCGLFFADAEYFSVGRIDREQLADYAARRNMDIETIEKLIPNNI